MIFNDDTGALRDMKRQQDSELWVGEQHCVSFAQPLIWLFRTSVHSGSVHVCFIYRYNDVWNQRKQLHKTPDSLGFTNQHHASDLLLYKLYPYDDQVKMYRHYFHRAKSSICSTVYFILWLSVMTYNYSLAVFIPSFYTLAEHCLFLWLHFRSIQITCHIREAISNLTLNCERRILGRMVRIQPIRMQYTKCIICMKIHVVQELSASVKFPSALHQRQNYTYALHLFNNFT